MSQGIFLDTDVIIWEGDPTDPTLKPPEMHTLIENFCLGLRRLELFGRARTLRKGWVSALADGEEASIPADQHGDVGMEGDDETPVRWNREAWEAKMKEFAGHAGGKCVVPMTSGTPPIPFTGLLPCSGLYIARNRRPQAQVAHARWIE